MNRAHFLLVLLVVNLSICYAAGENTNICIQRLQLSDVSIRKKDVLLELNVFQEKNDISALRKAIANLETIGGGCQISKKDFPAIRRMITELWVRVLDAIEEKYDKNFDYDANPPLINVIAPNLVGEGDLKEEYEKEIAENAVRLWKSNFNLNLKKIRSRALFVSSGILSFLYGEKPFNRAEFKEIVQGAGKEELRQKVLSHLESMEK